MYLPTSVCTVLPSAGKVYPRRPPPLLFGWVQTHSSSFDISTVEREHPIRPPPPPTPTAVSCAFHACSSRAYFLLFFSRWSSCCGRGRLTRKNIDHQAGRDETGRVIDYFMYLAVERRKGRVGVSGASIYCSCSPFPRTVPGILDR